MIRLQAIRRPLLAVKVAQAERRERAARERAQDADVLAHQRDLARGVAYEIARASEGRVPRARTPGRVLKPALAWFAAIAVYGVFVLVLK